MKKNFNSSPILYFSAAAIVVASLAGMSAASHFDPSKKWFSRPADSTGIVLVKNAGGPTLGYSTRSGVKILTVDGLAFKDLNKNGKLDKYEDWRLPVDERAKDLAAQLSIDQIAGLMLYSAHQAIPAMSGGPFGAGTYNGKKFNEGGIDPADVSDQQKSFLIKDNLRHVLVTSVQSPAVAARWNNNVQALVEGSGFGIPANNSSDPRHSANTGFEYTAGAGGTISQWPDELGLAATFDPAVTRQFGSIAAQEYRALGIATALSPQIDLGSEPRWARINGTFGEDPQLDADMARAYVDGFQTSAGDAEIKDGWGYNSVNAMMKHWPSGGPEEGGRDAHFAYGKFAVYPGNNFDEHLVAFVDGALKLSGKTKMVSAVMPYYTISYNRDKQGNAGNSYSKYLITDLLRGKYGYDGVICTDWMVTADEGKTPDTFLGKSWGMETATVAQRHYKILMAGVDQFGGNNDAGPVIEAYNMGVKEHGEAFMRARFEQSAVRLLKNIFRVGLFENPYLDVEHTKQTVGKPEFMTAGYNAQLKSIVMLKNHDNVLPLQKGKTIYMPKKYFPSVKGFFGPPSKERWEDAVQASLIGKYFNVTDDPAKADYAIVFVSSPSGGAGYDADDLKNGGNGYVPITLQYGAYTATDARAHSIAAGDPVEPGITNRSYKGKSITAANYNDLKTIEETKKAMNGKPVIVAITLSKPAVLAEFEKDANAIVAGFGVQNQAMLDVLTGAAEPSGLLPFQMPANMQTVEVQDEDIPHDMICYTDADGHTYDFGFGMNWKGEIHDARTAKYVGIVAKPVFHLKGNTVTLTCSTPGTKIYYTTNGVIPAFVDEYEFTKPFTIKKGTTIKAIAKKYGVDNSSMVVLVKN
ncbi:glycoside hydrolase family 3 N-terminal domain-containing protein [Mucilaginibacter gotjawali]|uniref:Beta-glucosidase n=2 Tax=Mucilaginibacter gotjawali TaxID=1550579 RepID=A0A839SEC0_9SPHI|nr:glycoside hydrolase family 3 N-terminal domain-containing protein [Mucilaginibacter gotjawali]MBB3056635.1 beta-glucosidase [Mucilaginibacter gotjawali]BAU52662.1 Periplasmic beta-glucosidase precursor [Mucilaginibacter gotjawali]